LALKQIETCKAKGDDDSIAFLNEQTGKSESALRNALEKKVEGDAASRLQAACGNEDALFKRVLPFANLIRTDSFGKPVVIRKGSVYVTEGTDRRSSGTHYTPKSLTEPIVQYTLEPLVFDGPAEGKPKEEWKLRSARELLDLKICDMACGSAAFLVQTCRFLSELLAKAWDLAEAEHPGVPGITPEGTASTGAPGEALIPKDANERLVYARRLVAQRCLYGVDKNPLAVEMAKLSLWLFTLAKDKPFTFLDHAIRCGDSLVGIHDLEQIKHFNLDPTQGSGLFTGPIFNLVDDAVALRKKIEGNPANTVAEVEAQAKLLVEADEKTARLRYAADLLLSVEFQPGNDKDGLHNDMAIQAGYYVEKGSLEKFQAAARKALNGQPTFHWPLEFPEVFSVRDGFDAMVNNPPFQAGTSISTVLGRHYTVFLKEVTPDAGNRADLAVYFLRRGFDLLRTGGNIGLVATNTIAEADSRQAGFVILLAKGGVILWACPNLKWPGSASLTISTFAIRKGAWSGVCWLSRDAVPSISSFLDAEQEITDPYQLVGQPVQGFTGSKVYGDGFILPRIEALSVLKADARNKEVVRPYWDGDQFNESPTLEPERFIVNFFDISEREARKYREPFRVVEERVKPSRMTAPEKGMREKWWQFQRLRKELYSAIDGRSKALMRSIVSKHHAFGFVDPRATFSHAVAVVASDSAEIFAILESNLHECWAIKYGSKHETRPRYTISDCFHTFPFPECLCNPQADQAVRLLKVLAVSGEAYLEHRRQIMLRRQEGLTKTYNRFHNPEETGEDIQKLRELHVEMDKTVAAAYGWGDLDLGHDFHETKQGLRFTISEAARREVLARLLRLNHERYAEEVAQGLHEKKGKRKTEKRRSQQSAATSGKNVLPYPDK
jgi:hypothetical protein